MVSSINSIHERTQIQDNLCFVNTIFGDNNQPKTIETDFHRVLFFKSGEGIDKIGSKRYSIEPHSIHIALKGQTQTIENPVLISGHSLLLSDANFWHNLPENFTRLLLLGESLNIHPIINLDPEEFGIADSLIGGLNESSQILITNSVAEDIKSYLNVLFTFIYIKYSKIYNINNLSSFIAKNSVVKNYLQLVPQYFKEHYSIKHYANVLCTAPNYLNELCKKELGITAQQVIKNVLIIEIKRLLLYSDFEIKEISYELGFSSPSHFSYFFKKEIGCSPKAFKSSLL